MKLAMLEYIAHVPYQAWERIGYLALARDRRRSALARRVFERIVTTPAEQDNEHWSSRLSGGARRGRPARPYRSVPAIPAPGRSPGAAFCPLCRLRARIMVADPGFLADPGYPRAPGPPRSPDPPR
jgi:hypothetical protein